MQKVLAHTKNLFESIVYSYAQIFFSKDIFFGTVLFLITFIDFEIGLSGLISILICQLVNKLFGFSDQLIQDGTYSYNALMVGLALGSFYSFNLSYLIFLVIAAIFSFFLTVALHHYFAKKYLPMLSIPFLIVVWVLILSFRNFGYIALVGKDNYLFYDLFEGLVPAVSAIISSVPLLADYLHLYFRSLGAIMFQFNDLAGILIVVGLIYYSRIAFVLSLFGFSIGYLFYMGLEGDFTPLVYSYVGFNFILTSIALGGFFIVPSKKSMLLLFFTIPVIAILISGFHSLFSPFELPYYSLPFNIVVILFISILQLRLASKSLHLVPIQQFSPELNFYKFVSNQSREILSSNILISLPVLGKYRISQGYDGDITHKEDWKEALDFDIIDEEGKTYKNHGTDCKDFYCYNLPVISPANGTVVKVLDGVEENAVGEVNLENNWGNTVIIKHEEYLYSKLSHLKNGSINVKEGDLVKRGSKVGTIGNSGRSPEPHLHFQLQSTPFIGSKTLNYPISSFLRSHDDQLELKHFDVPKEDDIVENISVNSLMQSAFNFTPGESFKIKLVKNNTEAEYEWSVAVDAYNRPYLYCEKTQSTLYFKNEGGFFYTLDYYGSKNSPLYYFFLGAYKVILGYYKNIEIKDCIPQSALKNSMLKIVQDFTAPIFTFLKAEYSLRFIQIDDVNDSNELVFKSRVVNKLMNKEISEVNFEFILGDARINQLQVQLSNKEEFKIIWI